MNNTEVTETLMRAIMKFTPAKQYDMVIEECSELTKAVCKYKRCKTVAEY